MFRSFRKLSAVLIIAVIAVGFVAAEPVQLTMSFYKQEITQTLPKLLEAFTKANPDIVIMTEIHPNDGGATNAAAAAAGKLPDIMQQPAYSAIMENAKNGYILDLSRQPVMSKVIDGAKPSVTYNGKLYALPMDFAGIGIIYSKDIFAKYRLNPPTTYLDLQKVSDTLKKNGVTPFAGLLKENWSIGHFIEMVHSSMLGARVGNNGIFKFVADMNVGATSWDKIVDINALFKIMDWYKANMASNAVEMAWDQQQAAYIKGEAAMMVQGLWALPNAKDNPTLKSGFIPFPWSNKAAENRFFADVDSTFTVSAQSSPAKQAAALKFINWLASPEAVKIWTTDIQLTSTFKGADVSSMPSPFVDLMTSVNKLGSYPWVFSMMPTPTWEQAVKNGAHGYILGNMKPSDIVAEINSSWRTNYKK
ncbi:MAG: extracellular solute-binding protein [Spirochaetes bacterium]|nr:extracellular solute-binding protein [Spirochaetota bacterium]